MTEALTAKPAGRRCRRRRARSRSRNRWLGRGTAAVGTPPVLAGAQLPSFRFQLGAITPKRWDGGWAKEATVAEFPVSEKLAGVLMSPVPGAIRDCTGTPMRRNGPM